MPVSIRKTSYKEKIDEAIKTIIINPATRVIGLLIDDFMYSDKILLIRKDEPLSAIINTAATDGVYIYVSEEFLRNELSKKDYPIRIGFTLLHEALHIVFAHTNVYRLYHPQIGNIATDCEVNRTIHLKNYIVPEDYYKEFIFPENIERSIVKALENTLNKIDRPDCIEIAKKLATKLLPHETKYWNSATVPSMYGTIMSYINKVLRECRIDPDKVDHKRIDDYIRSPDNGGLGDILDPRKTLPKTEGGKPLTPEEIEKRVREEIEKTRSKIEKYAGVGRGAILDILFKIHEPKIDWSEILEDIVSGRGEEVLSTWMVINRRTPYLTPGYKRLGPPRVLLILDVSGSITDQEYSNMLSEINEILERNGGNIYLIMFSDGVVGELSGEQIDIDEVKEAIRKAPHGGTVIYDALKKATEVMESEDVVMIFTDGYIFDVDTEEVKSLADTIASNVYAALYIYTGKVPEAFKTWITINYYDSKI